MAILLDVKRDMNNQSGKTLSVREVTVVYPISWLS